MIMRLEDLPLSVRQRMALVIFHCAKESSVESLGLYLTETFVDVSIFTLNMRVTEIISGLVDAWEGLFQTSRADIGLMQYIGQRLLLGLEGNKDCDFRGLEKWLGFMDNLGIIAVLSMPSLRATFPDC
jgi:hypothetical protein